MPQEFAGTERTFKFSEEKSLSFSEIENTVLTPLAKEFITSLHRQFNPIRESLLLKRAEKQKDWDSGKWPNFLASTEHIRNSQWKIASTPLDLQDRRVEITGPVERKMMINALNSGARVFMADFEDSLSPTWENVMLGHLNCIDAVRKQIELRTKEKTYKLNEKTATLIIRPRGWHLEEKNFLVDGKPISASLFDFGLYFFHNAKEALKRGSGPYFYIPKLESHLEARLWNDVFNFAQKAFDLAEGTIKATVLIETILAAFEMDEILFELRNHIVGLNAGRWDYLFSVIKKFRNQPELVLPDRAQLTMAVPFMHSYTELLVQTCHKRGAHAIGGMAAFIPNRKDPEVTARALEKVKEDKNREAQGGFDGTWVAHPDLVSVAMEIFDQKLGSNPNQKENLRQDAEIRSIDLLNTTVDEGRITEAGLRLNINVALQYIERWLSGVGAAAIHNLMEDAATAEISRAQIWQWIQHGAKLSDHSTQVTEELYRRLKKEEMNKLGSLTNLEKAGEVLDRLVLDQNFSDFLTTVAYQDLV